MNFAPVSFPPIKLATPTLLGETGLTASMAVRKCLRPVGAQDGGAPLL